MLLTPLARAYIFSVFAVLPAFVLGVSVFGPVMIIRRRKEEIWFERARYLHPFRKAVSLLLALELVCGAILSGIIQGRLGLGEDHWFMPVSIVGLLVGSFYSLYIIHRRVGGECPTFLTWLVEFGSISLLRLLFGLLAFGVGILLAPSYSNRSRPRRSVLSQRSVAASARAIEPAHAPNWPTSRAARAHPLRRREWSPSGGLGTVA